MNEEFMRLIADLLRNQDAFEWGAQKDEMRLQQHQAEAEAAYRANGMPVIEMSEEERLAQLRSMIPSDIDRIFDNLRRTKDQLWREDAYRIAGSGAGQFVPEQGRQHMAEQSYRASGFQQFNPGNVIGTSGIATTQDDPMKLLKSLLR